MSPFRLFPPHFLEGTILSRRLVEFLEKIGVSIADHKSGHRNVYDRKLAHSIYTTTDDLRSKEIAHCLCDACLTWDPSNPKTPRFDLDPTARRPPPVANVHSLAQHAGSNQRTEAHGGWNAVHGIYDQI